MCWWICQDTSDQNGNLNIQLANFNCSLNKIQLTRGKLSFYLETACFTFLHNIWEYHHPFDVTGLCQQITVTYKDIKFKTAEKQNTKRQAFVAPNTTVQDVFPGCWPGFDVCRAKLIVKFEDKKRFLWETCNNIALLKSYWNWLIQHGSSMYP